MFKLKNETKVAILAIAAVALGIWGFKFLKGLNVLTTSTTLYVRYKSVDQLRPSSPVYIKGFQVGMVKDMYIDTENDTTIIAVLNIDRGIDVPKDAIAMIVGESLMGGKAVDLQFHHACVDGSCAENGDYLFGATKSFLAGVLGEPGAIDPYMDRLRMGLTSIYDSIADPNDPQGLGRSLVALEASLRNMEIMTLKINRLLEASTSSLNATARNAADITNNLRGSNKDISATISNLAALTEQLKGAGLDKTSQKAAAALDSITNNLAELRLTLQATTHTISNVDTLTQNLLLGKGTIGKVLNDEEMYRNLLATTRQLHLIMQDLRLNPTRYTTVKVKLFGKPKVQPYVVPEEDPAYQLLIDSLELDHSRRIRAELRKDSLQRINN
ncbi:MAG: MlaD family protein [Saprospiraceae bacterium]